jgi:hypothetical protein
MFYDVTNDRVSLEQALNALETFVVCIEEVKNSNRSIVTKEYLEKLPLGDDRILRQQVDTIKAIRVLIMKSSELVLHLEYFSRCIEILSTMVNAKEHVNE